MKNVTKGILAASLLATGALGAGFILNANAYEPANNEVATTAVFTEGYEAEFSFEEADVNVSARITNYEDGSGSWEVVIDGEQIEYGTFDEAVPPFAHISVFADDETSLSDVAIETFETEEEFEAWLAEQDFELGEHFGFGVYEFGAYETIE